MGDEIINRDKWIICRICLNTSKDQMTDIFGRADGLAEEIADYGSITLRNTINFPEWICERCLLLLKAAKKFRKLCQNSAKQWHELVQLINTEAAIKIENAEQLREVKSTVNSSKTSTQFFIVEGEGEAGSLIEADDHQIGNGDTDEDDYVFEVIDNDEDNGTEENILVSQDAQYIEFGEDVDDDGMDFLEENNEKLTYDSNSQFEVITPEQTLHSSDGLFNTRQQALKKGEVEVPRDGQELDIDNGPPPKRKRGRKKTIAARKPSKKTVKLKYDLHMENEHIKKAKNNYICSYCGNVYKEKAKLSMHLKIHTKVKLHECEICHKRFAQTPQLRRHMNSHTGNRPYKCKFCEACFADPSTCIKHERIHTKERPYVCKTCGKAFSYSNVLKVHVMSHTGEKPYKCSHCDKTFKQSHHRKTHERTHR